MRSIFIVLALLASSCVTARVQDRTLLPAIVDAWPDVRLDAELGDMPEAALEQWDLAVETEIYIGLNSADLLAHAWAGIDLRLGVGEIGPVGAGVMRDRAQSFVNAVEEYNTSWLAFVTPAPERDYNERPLMITSGSWATNPPSAIASRTFR